MPGYTDILLRLMNSVNVAIETVNSNIQNEDIRVEDYRERVVVAFQEMSKSFIEELEDTYEYGATVSLQAYGVRNRDDIVRRIRLGIHRETEEAYTRLRMR